MTKTIGAVKKTLSKRSITPPCPGMMFPKSLMWFWRLMTDAVKSPSIPVTERIGQNSARRPNEISTRTPKSTGHSAWYAAAMSRMSAALPGASAVSAPPYTSGRGETLALARYLQCESAYLRIPNADDETRRGAAYANVLRRGAARLREAAERSANHA